MCAEQHAGSGLIKKGSSFNIKKEKERKKEKAAGILYLAQ
jgi:hypothetical protein